MEDDQEEQEYVEAKTFSHANGFLFQTLVLTERSFVNAGRNLILYWIRVVMVTAMAMMVGTTWWDLPLSQSAVQDRFSVMFFTVAFLCYMSVASIPAFIEDKVVYDRETSNAMYGVLPYVISNNLPNQNPSPMPIIDRAVVMSVEHILSSKLALRIESRWN